MLTFFFFFSITFLLLNPTPFSHSSQFQKTSFDQADPDLAFHGDATASLGEIQLTGVDNKFRVGWVTYSNRVRLYDAQKLTNFNTHFSFIIRTSEDPIGSDGLAFFLAPPDSEIPPNSAGGYLGLFNKTTVDSTSRNRVVMVEFDTHTNTEFRDPLFTHVGINLNSIVSVDTVPWNASSHVGEAADVRISYDGSTTDLAVVLSYGGESFNLSHRSDLRKSLPEWVVVGFSASTGLDEQRHIIKSWEFDSSLGFDEEEGDGGNVASPEKKSKKMKMRTAVVAAMSVLACFVVLGAFLVFVMVKMKKKEKKNSMSAHAGASTAMNFTSFNEDLVRGAGPRRFLREDLVLATDNFSGDRKLGEGGFGSVYKGFLVDAGMLIAVKRISRGSKQGRKEYTTEIKVFSQLRHRNLVQLIGWCHDSGEFLLVYEFMPNGSLDSHLFNGKKSLDWDVRHRVALGLASALLYLHEEGEQCVVHRDIKSSNIMLDSSFTVKLGDFGLARLVDREHGPQTTAVAGTFGYMAPEYLISGRASKESDVFGFGVVALEIATGRRCANAIEGSSGAGLVEWVWGLYGGGNLGFAVDARLRGSGFDEDQAECLMIVGLWCAHPDHTTRPSIRQAIQVLNFEAVKPSLPAKIPPLVYHVDIPPLTTSLDNSCQPFISKEAGR